MSSPWITIAIPAYNRAHLLQQTVNSVRSQTDEDWELFIVDDQSTDETWDVAQSLALQDFRITAERNPVNRGLAANFRHCGSLGFAPYVLLLAADDQLEREFLAHMHQIADTDPTMGLLCGRRVLYMGRTGRRRPYSVVFNGRQDAGATVARALRNGNLYGLYSAVVMRRDALISIGGIRDDNPWAGDFEAFIRIAARYPVYFDPLSVVYQYVDSTTQTSAMVRDGTIVRYEIETLQRLLNDGAVRACTAEGDIFAAWERIQAMIWGTHLYGRLARHVPSAIPTPNIPTQSWRSRWAIVFTLVRLIYHRWRLTY